MNRLKPFTPYFFLALIISDFSHAQQDIPAENKVKAAFVYNFAKFVSWPSQHDDSIKLCILKPDNVGKLLANLQGSSIGDRKLVIEYVSSPISSDCQILYLSSSQPDELEQILPTLEGNETLTIADSPGAGQLGTMLNFYRHENKLRFEINLDAVNRAGIKMSSKLIQLGTLVDQQQ